MMRTPRLVFAIAACTLPAPLAVAQPAAPVADKVDAKALMQSGLKLYAAQDYLGALAVFRTAYTRFPSAKILINIGTTLIKLDRKADAANTYQKYLDAPDTDPAKAPDVRKALAGLDKAVGVLEIAVTPADAELQFDSEDWVPARSIQHHRVAAGSLTVRVRRAAYQPDERKLQVTAGQTVPVAFALTALPVATTPTTPSPVAPSRVGSATSPTGPAESADTDGTDDANDASGHVRPGSSLARLGVVAFAHIDPAGKGGAGLVGLSYDLTSRFQAQATAILGPSYGAYLGASYAVLDGTLRPIVSAGAPIFLSNGARVALRGAGGVELALNRHLALIAELGVERVLNAEADIKSRTMFVPALGAAGRL
jgi:hypothetical protein